MYQFEKLEIWKKSLEIIKDTYEITNIFPREERYSLSSQIQRAIISVALNIAEGKGSQSDKEFSRFFFIFIKVFA